MKKLNLLILLFLSSICLAQSSGNYYYYFDEKISVEIDSSNALLIAGDVQKKEELLSILRNFDASYTIQLPYENVLNVTLSNGGDLQKTLKNQLPDVFISFSYKHSDSRLLVLNELILKPRTSLAEIESRFKGNVRLKREKKHKTALFEVLQGVDVLQIANEIHESGLVEWCQPNFIPDMKVGNPLYPDQYYLNNTGQFGGTPGIDINAPEAWALTAGCGIRVAVIDQGVNNHEDMDGRVVNGFDPVNLTNPGHPLGSHDNHGVACAGIIAASNNTDGIRGIAENAIIVPIKIFSGNSIYGASDIEDAIDWAWEDGEAEILNNSWGGPSPMPAVTTAINNATTYGRGGKGSVVVASSMNSYPTIPDVGFPANLSNVLAVGAIDKNGNIWSYSQRGSTMNLVAPSGNIGGSGDVRTTDRMGTAGYSSGNYTNNFGGTSAAAPQVAGVAALVLYDH